MPTPLLPLFPASSRFPAMPLPALYCTCHRRLLHRQGARDGACACRSWCLFCCCSCTSSLFPRVWVLESPPDAPSRFTLQGTPARATKGRGSQGSLDSWGGCCFYGEMRFLPNLLLACPVRGRLRWPCSPHAPRSLPLWQPFAAILPHGRTRNRLTHLAAAGPVYEQH